MDKQKEKPLSAAQHDKDIIAYFEEEREFLLQCYAFKETAREIRPLTREMAPFGRELIREIVGGGNGNRAMEMLTIEQQNAFLSGALQPTDYVREYYEEYLKRLLIDRGYIHRELEREFAKATRKTAGVYAEIKPVSELMMRTFEDARWIITGLIPEGLTLIVGKPKIGKSWFVLESAIRAAQGKTFIGYETEKSKVLYYALEDSERRLNKRIGKLGGIKDAENFYYSCTLEPLTAGGLDRIRENLDEGFRLIIIDTYARIKTATKRDAYAEETQALAGLQGLALAYQSAIILIHHARKNADSTDLYDQVLGSTALTGTADSTIFLQRDRKTHRIILSQTGRDIEDQEIAIDFITEEKHAGFEYVGKADDVRVSEVERIIIEHLKSTEFHLTPGELSQALNIKASAAKTACYRLYGEQKIEKEDGKQKFYYDKKRKYGENNDHE